MYTYIKKKLMNIISFGNACIIVSKQFYCCIKKENFYDFMGTLKISEISNNNKKY